MRRNIRTYLLVAAAVLMSATASAQVALPFIRIDRSPVTSGMAGAGKASLASPEWSAFGNSATLPFTGGDSFKSAVSYQIWAPNGAKTNNINAGITNNFGKFALALGAATGTGMPFTQTDDAGNITGNVSPKDLLLSLGFGLRFTETLGAGVNVRYASQSFGSEPYGAVGADVFVHYRKDALGVSAGVSSLGMSVKDASGSSYPIPASATLAADYALALSEGNVLEGVLDLDYFLSGGITAALGAQYSYNDMVFVRAGYHYGSEGAVLPSYASLGAGFKYKFARLDVAWLTANEAIGNTLCVGLGISF